MHALTFTRADFESPERLERLFQRLNQTMAEPPPAPPPLNLKALATSLAPLIRPELQATGIAPLNLQSLLPVTGLGVVLEDTHANRLALYPAVSVAKGTLFWETDRMVLYVREESSVGAQSWQYVSGIYTATFANRPTDLGANDEGFLLFITAYRHICRWTGAAWVITDGGGGYFVDSAIALGDGYQLCDGTATTYLAISGADLAETAFTTPDENSGAAGVYHKSIAAYSGTINAAVAPGISGSTAAEAAHTHAVDPPSTASGAPSATTTVDNDGAGSTVAVGSATHTHTTDIGSFTSGAGSSHLHGVGTLAVDATAEPRNMGVLRYFRR